MRCTQTRNDARPVEVAFVEFAPLFEPEFEPEFAVAGCDSEVPLLEPEPSEALPLFEGLRKWVGLPNKLLNLTQSLVLGLLWVWRLGKQAHKEGHLKTDEIRVRRSKP